MNMEPQPPQHPPAEGGGGQKKKLTNIASTKTLIKCVKDRSASSSKTFAFKRIKTRLPCPPPAATVHVRGAQVIADLPFMILSLSSFSSTSSAVVHVKHTLPAKRPSNSASSRSTNTFCATSAYQMHRRGDTASRALRAGSRARSCRRARSSRGEEERGREGAWKVSSRRTAACREVRGEEWVGEGNGERRGEREIFRSDMAVCVQG